MADDHAEIMEKLTTLIANSKNVENDISEMKADRKEASKAHWFELSKITKAIVNEKLERINDDNEIKTELSVTKVKVAGIVIVLSTAWTMFTYWIRSHFS